MKSLSFHYNITRKYPFRWFPWVVFPGGICATAILTIINLATNGYELHNVYTSNPNETTSPNNRAWFERAPWSWTNCIILSTPSNHTWVWLVSTLILATPTEQGVGLYTNNNAMRYTVGRLSTGSVAQYTRVDTLIYSNDNLHDCGIGALNIKKSTNSSFEGITVSAEAVCTVYNGSHPVDMWLVTSFEVASSSNTFDTGSPDFGDLGTNSYTRPSLWLGYINADWYAGTSKWWHNYGWQGWWDMPTFTNDAGVEAAISINDDQGTDITYLQITAPSLESWNSVFGEDMVTDSMIGLMTDGAPQVNSSDIHINASIYYDGIAKSVASLILSDLGQSNENNIFSSPQRTIDFMTKSNDLPTGPYGRSLDHNLTLWGWIREAMNASQSDAPTDITAFFDWAGVEVPQVKPTTFSMQYLCQVPKLKAFGSLFMGVVVADFVLLQVIWTLFVWITAYFLERRHSDARYCDGCAKAVALGQLNLDTEESSSSMTVPGHQTRCDSTITPKLQLVWSQNTSTDSSTARVDFEPPLVWSDTINENSDSGTQRRDDNNLSFSPSIV